MRAQLLAPKYWPTWLGLALLRALTPLPYRVLMALGRTLGTFVRILPLNFVRVARRNLQLCLPDLSEAAREKLLLRNFQSVGMGLFETALSWWGSYPRLRRLTRVEGMENLEAALKHGKGAILLSAHFTTLEMSGAALAVRTPINIMYRPTRNAVMAHFLARNRARRTRRAIRRDDVRTLVTALKANEPVWYAPDQSYRNKGAEMVPFFSIPAATNTATSRLAKLTGAVVIPYFPERLSQGRGYLMRILPALEHFPGDSPAEDALRFNRLIEEQIRRVPDQYLWLHRRFKGLGADYPDYYRTS